MRAFYDLSTCRSSGMSLGPIPWTAMKDYAYHHGLDWDVTEAFIDIIRTMDEAYMVYQLDEQKRLSAINKGNK